MQYLYYYAHIETNEKVIDDEQKERCRRKHPRCAVSSPLTNHLSLLRTLHAKNSTPIIMLILIDINLESNTLR
jgi:hypothetical protein